MSLGVRASGSRCLLGADRYPDGAGIMDHKEQGRPVAVTVAHRRQH